MKKIILGIAFVMMAFVGISQTLPNIVSAYDLTNGDTTFQQTFLNNRAWSIQLNLTDPLGNDGVVAIEESTDGDNWTLYASNFYDALDSNLTVIGTDSLYNVRISGTDTIYTYRYADDYFNANYIRVKIIQNTMTQGTLNGIINFKSE